MAISTHLLYECVGSGDTFFLMGKIKNSENLSVKSPPKYKFYALILNIYK